MIRRSPSQYPQLHAHYLAHQAYFPLIGAVLAGAQDGVVYADREANPTQVYVEHAFGFAQLFGGPVASFEEALQRYLLVDKAFSCPKVRLYTPHFPDFLQLPQWNGLRSWRQHFQLDAGRMETVRHAAEMPAKDLVMVHADASHVGLIERAFGVVERFWRTGDDFVRHSNAVLALVDGQAAALCYAAAVAGGRAEIDVLTLPDHRNRGLAGAVVRMFNKRCLAQDVMPLWDCFTNNAASMALCRSSGFSPLADPYPFVTINRSS